MDFFLLYLQVKKKRKKDRVYECLVKSIFFLLLADVNAINEFFRLNAIININRYERGIK